MQCQRCRGYLISDHFMDILNVSGEMNFTGWRCLNCGDITDPVIVLHHQAAPSAPAKSKRRWWAVTKYLNPSSPMGVTDYDRVKNETF